MCESDSRMSSNLQFPRKEERERSQEKKVSSCNHDSSSDLTFIRRSRRNQQLKVKMSYLRDAEQLNNQAVTLLMNGDLTNAIKYFKEANVLFEQVLGNHTVVATTLFNIGCAHEKMDERDAAMESYENALKMYKKVPGDNRVDIADVVYNMARLHNQNSDYDKALPRYYQSLAIREEVQGKAHLEIPVTTCLVNIGVAHEKIGQYDNAMESNKKALKIMRQQPTRADLDLAVLLYNMGGVYNKTSMHDEAMGVLQEALKIRKEIMGSENHHVALILFSIGSTHFQRSFGDTDIHKIEGKECLKCWEEALRIQKMTIGNHKYTAETLYFMGHVYKFSSCPDKALQAFQACLAVYRAIGINDGELVTSIHVNIATLKHPAKAA